MTYRIGQSFEYKGNDYWSWSAWIEAEPAELDAVAEVTWILHPTFKQPRRVSRDREHNFPLKTAGWGTFLLRAEVEKNDGTKVPLKHNVRLEYPADSEKSVAAKSAPVRKVYLSYSAEDLRVANTLRAKLEQAGLQVVDQSQLAPGDVWKTTISGMIAGADAVVGLSADQEISPWVRSEIADAMASAKPTWLLNAKDTPTDDIPDGLRIVTFDPEKPDASELADQLRAALL